MAGNPYGARLVVPIVDEAARGVPALTTPIVRGVPHGQTASLAAPIEEGLPFDARPGQVVRYRAAQGAKDAPAAAARSASSTLSTAFGNGPLGALVSSAAALATSGKAREAIGQFVTDLIGGAPSKAVTKTQPAAKAPPTPAKAVAASLEKGRAAAPEITTQDYMMQAIKRTLEGGYTRGDLERFAGVVPALAQVNAKVQPSAKDSRLQIAGAIADKVYQDQVAGLLAQRKAGELDEERYSAAFEKATDAYFARSAGLVGFNNVGYAQAGLIPAPEDQ